jgi:4-hydroxybutyrate dehydrogenase
MGTPPGTAAADALAALNARVGLPGTIRALGYRGNDHDGLAAFAHDNYFNRTSPRIPGLDDYRRIIAELLH